MDADQIIQSVLPTGWVSLGDLSRALGVHQATLFRWARRGVRGVRLRTTKLGGRTGVCSAELSRFLEQLNTAKKPQAIDHSPASQEAAP